MFNSWSCRIASCICLLYQLSMMISRQWTDQCGSEQVSCHQTCSIHAGQASTSSPLCGIASSCAPATPHWGSPRPGHRVPACLPGWSACTGAGPCLLQAYHAVSLIASCWALQAMSKLRALSCESRRTDPARELRIAASTFLYIADIQMLQHTKQMLMTSIPARAQLSEERCRYWHMCMSSIAQEAQSITLLDS